MKTEMRTRLLNHRGQSMAEMIVILPILIALTGAAMGVAYMCWQGIKTQQAANLAARIQGQERVAGGYDESKIRIVNGQTGLGDVDPTRDMADPTHPTDDELQRLTTVNNNTGAMGVYKKIRDGARGFFGAGEQNHLFVPQAKIGANTDTVKVVRVMTPPKVFGLQLKPVVVEATAYGGEDPHAWALPRWGATADNISGNDRNLYWKRAENLPKGND